MREKRIIIVFMLVLGVVAGRGFASAMAEERAVVPAMPTAVVVGPEARLIKDPPLARWGRQVALINDTGYPLVRFDLYNQAMVQKSDALENLLTELLDVGERQVIDLFSHLPLYYAIADRDGLPFFYTAVDDAGDYYYGQWDPAHDGWNITLTFASYRPDYLILRYPPQGETIAVVNRGASNLVSFSLEATHFSLFDGSEENLIKGSVVPPGARALIPASLFAESGDGGTLYYTAFDSESARYRGSFALDEPSWVIMVGSECYSVDCDGYYTLFVNNYLDETLVHLWAMDGQEYVDGQWTEDLLGMQVILGGEAKAIDLYGNELWADRLTQLWEGLLYLVAETSDGDQYLTSIEVSSEYPSLYVDIFESDDREGQIPDPLAELVLYNRTGGALWYLYAGGGLDVGSFGVGDELLGDLVWEHDQFITLSVDGEQLDESRIVRLYAVDPDGQVYSHFWSEGAERLITFRQGDRVE